MYNDYNFVCPVCGTEREVSIENNVINKDADNQSQIIVLSKNDNDSFNCEVTIKCKKCRHSFRENKEMSFK